MTGSGSISRPSRREVLHASACAAGAGLADRMRRQASVDADLLDRGLERLHALIPDASVHRSNHVAMVIEALGVLGEARSIEPWLDANLGAYEPAAAKSRPIDPEDWKESLGRTERALDWHALFLAELVNEDWRTVLRRWVPRLAPGLAAAATHGLIRSAHATRSLEARDNELRRRELATGLAYWAASYQELPWDGSLAPETSVEAALARLEPRLPAREPPPGNIIAGLTSLSEMPSFLPVAGLVDSGDPERTLGEMSAAFARLYLRNPERRIHFTHSITAPSALRLLAPHLDEESVRTATRHAWQAAAGLYVVYGDPRKGMPDTSASSGSGELATRAVQNGGAHAIKLTEACLREQRVAPDPSLERVARDAGENLNG